MRTDETGRGLPFKFAAFSLCMNAPPCKPKLAKGADLFSLRHPGAAAVLALALLLGSGCAVTRDSRFSQLRPCAAPQERVRVAVLTPQINPALRRENLTPENPWYERLGDGRGSVVTSGMPDVAVGWDLVILLNRSKRFSQVFPVTSREEAARLGADRLLLCTVHDYRTINRGANRRYPLMFITSPLMSMYWIPWLTLEAKLDLEAEMIHPVTGERFFHNRLQRSYTKTVRLAMPAPFTKKMLNFLQVEATPECILELFDLDRIPPEPEVGPAQPVPEPCR